MPKTMWDWLTGMTDDPIQYVVIGDVCEELATHHNVPRLALESPHRVVLTAEDAAPWLTYAHEQPWGEDEDIAYEEHQSPYNLWQPIAAWTHSWVICTLYDDEYHTAYLMRVPRNPDATFTMI